MIQIFGKSSMLGIELVRAAEKKNIQVDNLFIDITDVCAKDIVSNIVINCSNPGSNRENREKIIAINRDGPHKLARACDEAGARLVHVSTDAVFNRPGPHPENHRCDPSSTIGRYKMLGEVYRPPHLTIRTSFIGHGRHGIVSQLLYTKDIIQASTKFLWSGHTSSEVASLVLEAAMKDGITGVLHIPGEFQNRYDLVMRLVELFDLDKSRIVLDDSYITDRRLISLRWSISGLPFPTSFNNQISELL